MILQDKLRLLMRDYTVSDILFSLSIIFREDGHSFFERNELISAKENYIISHALTEAGAKVSYIPQYGVSSTPEPIEIGAEKK